MTDRIRQIIQHNPKRYSQIIKSDPELSAWVEENTQVISDQYAEIIYSAMHQQSNLCNQGNQKKFLSVTQGWGFCGISKVCACNAQNSSVKVQQSKSLYTQDQKNSINQKRQKSMEEKYGVGYNSQRSDIHHIWQKNRMDPAVAEKLQSRDWLEHQYIQQKKTLVEIADDLGVYYSTVGEYCRQHGFKIRQRSNYSLEEKQISDYLTALGITHEPGDWDVLNGRELDIWIPDHNLAIEINGLFWHSFHPSQNRAENRKRHLEKTTECEQKKIDLIHITDWEWHNQKHIIKNLLMSKLNKNQRVGARQCKTVEITNSQANAWFKQYHLQGATPAYRSFALVQDTEFLLVISIGRSRFDSDFSYELLRMCGAPGVTVSGGLSKLMTYIKNQLNQSDIVTYCDRSKSRGQGYVAAGFQLIRSTDPGYFWTDGTKIVSRYQAQKSRLSRWLPNFDPGLSESQNMFANRYRRYWDCGNWVLKY